MHKLKVVCALVLPLVFLMMSSVPHWAMGSNEVQVPPPVSVLSKTVVIRT